MSDFSTVNWIARMALWMEKQARQKSMLPGAAFSRGSMRDVPLSAHRSVHIT
jgi:hypothetical protein